MYSSFSRIIPNLLALLFIPVNALVLCISANAQQTVIYEASDERIANPERGFYHYIETSASQPNAYDLNALRSFRENEDITLLYCINYLDSFVSEPISSVYLNHFNANMNTVREAGLKCILRFAYTKDDPTARNEQPPFGDASREQILAHIEQLGPLLTQHADVIAILQAGFIGVWGEWYYTDHFVDNPAIPWQVSESQQARRLEIVEALLAHVPETHQVAVRYPSAKQGMLKRDAPILAEEAFLDNTLARIGFHNDCFLAGEQDFGTYRNEADRQYLAQESNYVAMGGETCQNNPPRSSCENALDELEQFHWTYLNMDYHPQVISSWRNEGCLDDVEKKIGYRLTLKRGIYPEIVQVGDPFSVQFEIENFGWSAPIKNRPLRLIAVNKASGKHYQADLPALLQTWEASSSISLDYSVCTSAEMPVGEYELVLHLPDPEVEHLFQANYSIRFANQGLWDEVNGFNRLNHTLYIEQGSGNCVGPILLDSDEVATYIEDLPTMDEELDWTVFPNPTREIVHIKLDQDQELVHDVTLEVFDMLGRVVINKQIRTAPDMALDLGLKPGVYAIRLSSHRQYSVRLVTVLEE